MAGQIGVAVIGAGMAGRAHLAGYRSAPTLFDPPLPPLRYVAAVDANEAVAKDAAARYGYERASTDWHELLDDDDVQVVSVVVANQLHRPVVEALLAAGKHVLCEKPLAPSLDDARAMIAAAAAHPEQVTGTGFVYRRQPGVAAIRDLLQQELGDVSHFDGRYWCDYARSAETPMAWRYKGGPGTGALSDIGSHLIDMAEFLCGPLSSVSGATFTTKVMERAVPIGTTYGHAKAQLSDVYEPVENDDVAAFNASFASGAIGTFSVSRIATGHANSLGFEVLAERGAARWDMDRPAEFSCRPPAARRRARRVQPGPRRAGAPVHQGRAADGLPRASRSARGTCSATRPAPSSSRWRGSKGYRRWPPSRTVCATSPSSTPSSARPRRVARP